MTPAPPKAGSKFLDAEVAIRHRRIATRASESELLRVARPVRLLPALAPQCEPRRAGPLPGPQVVVETGPEYGLSSKTIETVAVAASTHSASLLTGALECNSGLVTTSLTDPSISVRSSFGRTVNGCRIRHRYR